MTQQAKEYVSGSTEGGWRISGTRVSIDSVIQAYWEGYPPEDIAAHFPPLSLEQVYGAITFYLAHRAEVDSYLASQSAKWEQLRQQSEARNGPLLQRLRQIRQQTAAGTKP
jgi:uncharacterized protein (DUF433 family)